MFRILIKDTSFPVPSFPPVGNDRITFCQHLLGDTFPPNITLFGKKIRQEKYNECNIQAGAEILENKICFSETI